MTTPTRVLIVDDDVPTRVGIRTILGAEEDIHVAGEAASSQEATELAARLQPDVVLMDIRLPDADGIETTRRIMGAGLESPPKVVVLTTFDFDEYAYQSLRAGASAFLLKRTSAEDLVATIRAVASGDTMPNPESTCRRIAAIAARDGTRGASRFQERLTSRETDVLALMARGVSNQAIAGELGVSLETVRTHVKHIYTKCGAQDRAQAVIAAYESGLVPGFP
jgi:DNA-binding NarL/FixJ family response regulator